MGKRRRRHVSLVLREVLEALVLADGPPQLRVDGWVDLRTEIPLWYQNDDRWLCNWLIPDGWVGVLLRRGFVEHGPKGTLRVLHTALPAEVQADVAVLRLRAEDHHG